MSGGGTVITIDGPAGSGKTTVARMLARRLGWGLLESGSLYRAFTWILLREAPRLLESPEETAVANFLRGILPDLRCELGEEGLRIYFRGRRLSEELRAPETEARVSEVAALGAVRRLVNEILRGLVRERDAVAEGRDMGSVVFPEARYKFYLTASPEVRARRRYLEWKAKGLEVSEKEVLEGIKARDHRDSSRREAPLSIPEGAVVIDTSELSPEEVLRMVLAYIE